MDVAVYERSVVVRLRNLPKKQKKKKKKKKKPPNCLVKLLLYWMIFKLSNIYAQNFDV